jgi:hypothetical protein
MEVGMRALSQVTTPRHAKRLVFLIIIWGCIMVAAGPTRLALAQDAPPLLGTAVEGVDVTTDIPLDFILPSGFVLSGTVQNADGSPVFLGTVTAQTETQAFDGIVSAMTFPPTYRIVLPVGSYRVAVTTPIIDPAAATDAVVFVTADVTEPLTVMSDLTQDIIVPPLPPLFPVSGLVSSAGTLPAVGSLQFQSGDGNSFGTVSFTGAYSLNLPAGDYHITAIVGTDAPAEPLAESTAALVVPLGTLTVSGPQTFDLLLPATLTLAGTVRHSDGTPGVPASIFAVAAIALPPAPPLPEADLGCTSASAFFGDSLLTVGVAFMPATSTTGAYSLALPPGAYQASATLDLTLVRDALESGPGSLSFPVPGLPLELATDLVQDFLVPPLPGTALISGTVTDGLGQPVAGAAVSASTSLLTNTPNASFTTETVTDSTGRYTLLTLSGTSYTLVVCPPFSDPFAITTGP